MHRRALIGGFLCALAISLAIVILNWRHSVRMREAADWVAHTHKVQAELTRLLSLMQDVEIGERGFVITGDPAFLAPFESATQLVENQQTVLGHVIIDETQRSALESIRPLLAARVEHARAIVDLRKTSGFEASRAATSSGVGKVVMDRLRVSVAEMNSRQEELLRERSAAAESRAKTVRWVTVAGGTLSAAMLGLAFWALLRENGERARAESELRALSDELEKRVAQRTAELAESERRHRTLLAHLPGLAYRMLNKPEWPAEFISDGSRQLIGLPPDEVTSGRVTFSTLIHPEDADRVWQLVQQAVARHAAYELEYRIRHADGTWRWVWEKGGPVSLDSGEVVALEGFLIDITARKAEESQRLRVQRLESIGTLAGGLAHDLNNALAPILMGLELIRNECPGATKIVNIMQASVYRSAEMIRRLVTFAKGAEGERRPLRLEPLIAEIEKFARATFPKDILIKTSCAPNLHPIVADSTQLHQVLLNLCVNARDAMPDGGTLTVDVENTQVDDLFTATASDAKPGEFVVCRISDTGTGIPPEIIDRIFDPFFTTKGPDKGTGLGLATVAGIVKSHGGFVRVHTEPQKGTTFAVYLPSTQDQVSDEAHLTAQPAFGRGEMILLVDDEESVRHIGQQVISAFGFNVLTAADGTEALMLVAIHRAQLRVAITDLHMPQMDGVAFARVLKRLAPLAGVVVATGRMDEHAANQLTEMGITTWLQKPFTQEKLLAAIRSVLPADDAK